MSFGDYRNIIHIKTWILTAAVTWMVHHESYYWALRSETHVRVSGNKVVLGFNEVPRHKDVLYSGGIAQCILNLSTRWRTVVNFVSRPFYPRGRAPCSDVVSDPKLHLTIYVYMGINVPLACFSVRENQIHTGSNKVR